MNKHKRQLIQDIIILIASIIFAVFMVKIGIARKFILSLGDFQYFGVFLAGTFFTSIFTIAPSIVVLSEFAQNTPLFILAVFGGLGAFAGDYIIFSFIKDRVADDLKYLFSLSKKDRFFFIHQTRLLRFLIPFLGALIIASPLPDEIGIMMLGLSKVKGTTFFLISFLFNGLGILIIGTVARIVT